MVKSGYFVGLNHGHIVTKPKENPNHRRENASHRKGRATKRTTAVRSIVNEIAGFSPYERKIIEMLRTGDAIKEKKALKMARRKLGRLFRAKRKVENLAAALKAMRAKK